MGFTAFKSTGDDFSQDFKVITDGAYNAIIEKEEDQEDKGRIALTLSICDEGEFKGCKVFGNINYEGEADKVAKGRKKFAQLGKAVFGDDREFNLSDIHTKFVKITTKNSEFQGKNYNNIFFYSTSDFQNETSPF